MEPILIVDDEVEMRIAMSETLKHSGYPVELSHNAIDALNKCKKNSYSMVITDMTMPKRSGIELLKDIRKLSDTMPVVMVTAYGTIETAVEAMKLGAFDYILKPFKFDLFTFVVERALSMAEERKSRPQKKPTITEIKGQPDSGRSREIVTADPIIQQLLGVAENIAKSKATVLVQSESGTGKELLARYIHLHSDRPDGPFVAVNCAALPETLLESELFGHRKGAFTGAIQDHKGRFEQASGGTILLDEVSELALPLQAKLLRVLQEHEVDRIGGKEPIAVDIRVIATTNQDLFARVEEGRFREDLYFRLNVIPLQLPPLRERKGDIPLLCDHFVTLHAARNGRKAVSISAAAMEVLCHYNWRGNVRELENVMERALLLCADNEVQPQHLLMGQATITDVAALVLPKGKGKTKGKAEAAPAPAAAGSNGSKPLGIGVGMSMREAEKKLIFETLRELKGNRTQAAKMLSISIRTLRNKLSEYAGEGEKFDFDKQD
ncbi:MAG: sigma-54 dependent transcriptional regulator [SAR324 cluster bacterium]|nr:sigma-54 dependent transcriptional regulator [SAR324 cluster bacterium]MCZ6533848.1 sigma-54 dependent transcriptional regulator [SAR324 cluster bacterium]MCZ6558068.1 sigma-54 dependent transcriptional regulator [SAR324 cluster bacterium]MCZ6627978.1 sigma-54 dependent transcriptional regulator [SAR324 cluster bacterium]MCZ6645330.1 sigma-54 dependent transcriptional regulator [SAR324 cluster bacterium]